VSNPVARTVHHWQREFDPTTTWSTPQSIREELQNIWIGNKACPAGFRCASVRCVSTVKSPNTRGEMHASRMKIIQSSSSSYPSISTPLTTATSWPAFGSNAMLGRIEHAPVYAAMHRSALCASETQTHTKREQRCALCLPDAQLPQLHFSFTPVARDLEVAEGI
jgi:hypothetical protein